MRIPLGWLQEHVTWDLTTEQLAERLTLGGLEVGSVEHFGETWDRDKIWVGEVVSVRQHPDADRLVLVTVEYGANAPLEVVTGAPNLHVGDSGQKVVFATVGASLIDAYADTLKYKTLKRSKIRGVPSEGMVCSERELGISDEHTGIVILPDDAPVGTPFVDYFGDTIVDIDLTPNLARCFSIAGVAREVAALTGREYDEPEPTVSMEGESIDGTVDIVIEDPDLCPRYSAALIRGVSIGPSPHWMQRRLTLAGMRPISNIVDITNYVMLELGQPLHAFDYHMLRSRPGEDGPAIIVRRAKPGEQMRTLDGEDRTFTDDMLLITDGGGAIGIAGIMGGEESEVSDQTVDVLLEAANFDFISIRRTSEALKIPSEAAVRFGRGVDPELTLVALRRAIELMRVYGGGTVAEGFIDVYPRKPEQKIIDLPVTEIRRLLGIELSAQEIVDILERLGFSCDVIAGDPDVVRVSVPSFRLDVTIPADLIEEIARIYGYDRLPLTLMDEEMPAQLRSTRVDVEESVRDTLVGCGLNEVITYSMTNLASLAKIEPGQAPRDPESLLKLANPLSRDLEYMRPTLINTTLENVAKNLRYVDRVATFEIGHVYLLRDDYHLPAEPTTLSVALCGPKAIRSWMNNESPMMDFYDIKGIVETVLDRLGVQGVTYAAARHPAFHPGRSATVSIDGVEAGVFGQIHPQVAAAFDLRERGVCLLEMNLDMAMDAAQQDKRFSPISPMPPLKMDLALVVDEGVPADEIAQAIKDAGGALLVDVVLFDVYRGEQAGAGKKSLAYSLTFQAPDKTLKSQQANKQRDRIVKSLERAYGAQIRS